MEKYIEVLIFLAFAAFSLLSQFLNRKKKAVTRAPEEATQRDFRQPQDDDPPVTARPKRSRRKSADEPSLRDILRELSGQPPLEEEDDYELPPYLQEKKEEIGAPPPPQLVDPVPKKLADKVSLEDDGKRIKPVEAVKKKRGKRSMGASLARSLRHPENAKKAIILSEILQRKYQ